MATEPLHDLPDRETTDAGRLASLDARLDAQSPQAGNGLRATFALVNTGGQPVELLNPLDMLQWQLLDEAGAPLEVPSRPSNVLVQRQSSAPWKLDPAVPLVEVRRTGERIDVAAMDTPTVELEPQGELASTFEFDRTLKDGAAVELASGDYRLVCLATLIDATDTDRSRIVRSNPLPVRFDRG
jgi:hypothetical protein